MKNLAHSLRSHIGRVIADLELPPAAKAEIRKDRQPPPAADCDPAAVIDASLEWLCVAQDNSPSHDGGVARDYSLATGSWASSYPETTGYITPTMLEAAHRRNEPALAERARRMLDWLVSIQFPEGGFQGGKIDAVPRVPVTFNTGQILLGLAAGGKWLRAPQTHA